MRWLADIPFRRIATALSDLAAPRLCLGCGRELGLEEEHLCLGCLADLPFTHFWERRHNPMADKVNAKASAYIPHGLEVPYMPAAALFYYDALSGYRNIPIQLKYQGNIAAGRAFAALLGKRLASSEEFADVDLVIPVPLHWTRRLRRGYNQSEVIAAQLSAAMGARLDIGSLRRMRRTRTQTRMSMKTKEDNVSGAFSCTSLPPARHILLVDDTFTTGATLSSCYAALMPHMKPGTRVSFATLAYVGNP